MSNPLQRDWRYHFAEILGSSEKELTISSPYISDEGVDFLLKHTNSKVRKKGTVNFVTDLSPQNIYQGSTNPNSFKTLLQSCAYINLWHLPRLHAKVYVSDNSKAIITSGNLTAGGLFRNFEYGIEIGEKNTVAVIKNDIVSYSNLGAKVSFNEISSYCEVASEINKAYKQKEISARKEITQKFRKLFQQAEDKLIQFRLAEGAIHTVFEKTVLYLLKKYGTLTTAQIHGFVEQIHPDLCDSSVDRVIDGKRFGKKWKHAVRTAQQHLKKKDMAILEDGFWKLKS